jgi:RimJ/RimL family protein N-acetyltransferase
MTLLRDARRDDVPALCAAERAVAAAQDGLLVSEPEELCEEAFAARIERVADGRGKYLVVEQASEIVAHACLWPLELRRVAHVLRLDMCVHVGHWRQGYGRRLLAALVAWARDESPAHKIELQVRATNLPAISLYQSFGFVEEGRLRDRVRLASGELVDDVCMGLILGEAALTR